MNACAIRFLVAAILVLPPLWRTRRRHSQALAYISYMSGPFALLGEEVTFRTNRDRIPAGSIAPGYATLLSLCTTGSAGPLLVAASASSGAVLAAVALNTTDAPPASQPNLAASDDCNVVGLKKRHYCVWRGSHTLPSSSMLGANGICPLPD